MRADFGAVSSSESVDKAQPQCKKMSLVSLVAPDTKLPFCSASSISKNALIDYGRKSGSAKTFEIYQHDEMFEEENIHNGVIRRVNESRKQANTSTSSGDNDNDIDNAYSVYDQKDEFLEENIHTSVIGKANENKKESSSTYNDEAFEMYWKNGSFVEVSVEDRSICKAGNGR